MWFIASVAWAGLGPAGTVVLFNADSPQATSVAEHYAEVRELGDGHLCGVTGLDPALVQLPFADFDTLVRGPLEACIGALPHPDEIDTLVTVRGLPYRVQVGGTRVGFEAALQVMRATDLQGREIAGLANGQAAAVPNPTYAGIDASCPARDMLVQNPAGGWYRAACALTRSARLPRAFHRDQRHRVDGWDFQGHLVVVGRLDGFDFDDAHALVDRGAAADGAFPTGEFLCLKGADPARSARDPECEYTVRRMAEIGANAVWLPVFDGQLAGHEVVALFTGAADFRNGIEGQIWAPGAVACNLTSFGAVPNNFFCDATGSVCPETESQTSIARFVRAGATGAHGTVDEPLNNAFPSAAALLLYHEGYSLGESFLYATEFLYWHNLVLGDPLATPFAERPVVQLLAAPTEDAPLQLTATHPDGVQSLVLYVDGARVAEAVGGELTWDAGRPEGQDIAFLAVATAASAALGRPAYDGTVTPPVGWDIPNPEAGQRVRPDTQGWLRGSVTVGAGTSGSEPTEEPAPKPCGCSSPAPPVAWGWVLVGLGWRRARRRQDARDRRNQPLR